MRIGTRWRLAGELCLPPVLRSEWWHGLLLAEGLRVGALRSSAEAKAYGTCEAPSAATGAVIRTGGIER